MNIVGLNSLVFGVDDLQACHQYFVDYGLTAANVSEKGGRYEALDGTCIEVRRADDASLPKALGPAPGIREIVYGVADAATLHAIAAELGKDREVKRDADGTVHSVDDLGFALAFQLDIRRPFTAPKVLTNAPGQAAQRLANDLGIYRGMTAAPRTLSHVVLFVPDAAKAEAFYTQRLKFVTTDRFVKVGPFMRPAGTQEHHCLFMIQTPPHMIGCEHFAFHMGSGTEVLLAGTQFEQKGYKSFWGPGRHFLGSNWFWYFNSPLGCHVEYDADMDLHDDSWTPRDSPFGADYSQLFLFAARDKWAPGG